MRSATAVAHACRPPLRTGSPRRGGWRGARPLEIPVVPGQVSLHPVELIAWPLEAVGLSRIDHQLGRAAEAAERLIHLLRVEQRHVEVRVAAKKKRGGHD